MQTAQPALSLDLGGDDEQQKLAEQVFRIFASQGRFYGEQSAIRLTLSQLADAMQRRESGKRDWTASIDAALSASPAVFARVEQDAETAFVTTRAGRAPSESSPANGRQTFIERFTTPEPARERPKTRHVVPQSAPMVSEYLPSEPELLTEWQDVTPAERARRPSASTTPIQQLEDERIVEEPVVAVPAGAEIDVSASSDEDLADTIRASLSREMSVAQWGDRWMSEDRVQRFSRGDLRRIEDFLRDQDGISTDEEIVQDVLGLRPNAPEYDAARFALNYRLSRENRDFEYLGTDTAGLWALANLPQIGTSRRKSSEIGQDYRFLLDYRTPEEGIEGGLIEHILSFYEYQYGVLPLDANFATIMPRHGFAEQRAARLTFESPQTTETVVAELRFPTSNRGGYIAGLDAFFAENLIPGAVLTIESTEEPNHFLLEYFRVSAEDRKLLHLDDRKGKYTFRSTTYYCATQDEFVLSENRYPKLADAKPLDERARRRPEQVVAATFERIGENVGTTDAPRYSATFSDLLAAANIERPISQEFLHDILTSGTYQEFSSDDATEDIFFYNPGA